MDLSLGGATCLILLQSLPTASYLQVPDLSLDNLNTAIQLTQILYKVSSPYSDNLQWESLYPETFWQGESYKEEEYFETFWQGESYNETF